MPLTRHRWLIGLSLVLFSALALAEDPDATPGEQVNRYLSSARVSPGVAELAQALERSPEDDELRFALGFMQFAAAIEHLGQAWYDYGLRTRSDFARMMPFLRLPVPENPEPESIDYDQARAVLERLVEELDRADATLAGIDDPDVRLDLFPGRGYLDFNGNGTPEDDEALWRVVAAVTPRSGLNAETAAGFRVGLDAADVHWLRGYSNLLSSLLDFYLSHDGRRLFDHTAHLYFAEPDTPHAFLAELEAGGGMTSMVFDAIAMIHLIDLPVIEPARRQRVVSRLQTVIEQSRSSWRMILEESDDDREWVPAPGQTGVIPNAEVTPEMIDAWQGFLEEAESILAGETLVPFWRGRQTAGINLRRALLESERFDLVLWLQGTGVAPYFEDGPVTDSGFWRELRGAFGGRLIGFALWFN